MGIIKRNDRWCVKVSVHGKQHWVGTFQTKHEARQAEASFLATHKDDNEQTETCAGFAERWLREFPRERASTQNHYRQVITKFADDFGPRALDSITIKEARAWALRYPSRASVVRTMYSDAMFERAASVNPFSNLRLPGSKGRKHIDAQPASEVERLANCATKVHGAYGLQYAAMIRFAAYSGLRRNELTVLEWSDIDMDRDEISVTKTLSNDSEILLPKNGKPRLIVLSPQAKAALKDVPRRLDTNRIFSTKTGKMFTKSTFHYAWNPVRCAFGDPGLDWHELRHFCATYMLQHLKLPATEIAHQLGHSDGGRLVLTLYAHPDEGRMRDDIREAFRRDVA